MQGNRWLQALIVMLTFIAAFFLLGLVWSFVVTFSNLFLLFFLSWLLAFILRPIARWLTNQGMPNILAVAVVYLAVALIFIIGGLMAVPVITEQVSRLANGDYNNLLNELSRLVDGAQKTLISWGVRDVDINKFYNDLAGQVQSIGMGVLSNTVNLLQSIATLVLQFVLVFILSFYFMKDSERIFGGMLQMLPPRWQDEARLLAISVEKSFGAFVRGQLVFALFYGIFTAIVMLLFKLDYVLVGSIVAGLCMIIPLVGNFLAFVPPLLVCLLSRPDQWGLLMISLFVAQSFMMNVVGPRIMSQAIGIHPLYVMAAMLLGGQVYGFWGALFGIPVAGTMNLVGRPLMRRLRYQMPLYHEVQGTHLTTRQFTTGPLRAAVLGDRETTGAVVTEATTEEATAEAAATAAPAAPSIVPGDGTAETVPHSVPRTTWPAPGRYEDEMDEMMARQPTLSGRAWHLAWVFVSRAYNWVGVRAHIRSSRQ